VRLAKKITFAAGACGLAVTTASAATATAAVTATTATAALANVIVTPGVVHVGRTYAGAPPTTAQCEAQDHIACYGPAQIQQAYNLPSLYSQGINGKDTTIVIVDSYGSPTITHDLSVFDSTYGLQAPPSFQIIQPAGKVPPYNVHNSDVVGWAGETTLDVEYAHTVAPDANILLVETPTDETEGVQGFPQMVAAEKYVFKHYHVDVVSQSFSATEQTFPNKAAVEALRGANYAAEADHVTMLAASGDSGAADVDVNGNYYLFPVTSWSDSDPLVTGVGGTELFLNAAGDQTQPAAAWNDTYNKYATDSDGPSPLAGGGGKSIFFSRPSYQNGVADVVGDQRGVPDIAMSAACNGAVQTYSSFPGAPAGWSQSCGTSEATPLFAGIVALAAQVAGHGLGLINPALYQLSEEGKPGIVPVSSGDNTVTFKQNGKWYTVQGWHAKAVYSLADGVGTVDAQYFVPELAALAG
jgi:subtilase family serine protease